MTTANVRSVILKLERELARAEKRSARLAEVRSALPAGSTRARVTTANARWARAAEYRDLVARQLDEARSAWAAVITASHKEP